MRGDSVTVAFTLTVDAAMSKTVEEAIAELVREITAEELVTNAKKNTVNVLCGVEGRAPIYRLDEPAKAPESSSPLSFRSDAFYGEPLASSAKKVLEASKAGGGGALPLDALYEALKAGGFAFDAKSDATARRSLAISLSKNTAAFVRLPNGNYGLKQWYGRVVRQRGLSVNGRQDDSAENAGEADENSYDFSEVIAEPNQGSAAGLLPAPAADSSSETEDREL